jgi:hypothetical protein
LIALLLGAAILQKDGGAGFPTAKTRSNAQWAHLYAALPLSFEANWGQTDPRVNFLSRGRGFTLFLTDREAVLTLKNSSAAALRLQLLGANAHALLAGSDELPGKANYFIGNDRSKWRTNVPTYAKVRYASVYPGVDLVYYGTQGGELEYDFVVAPGADPQAIALGIETQEHAPLRINSQGDLVVALPNGNVQLHKPVVYQTASDSLPRTVVEGHFALDVQNHVRFDLGPYNHSRPLIIDPVLVYATYVGGSGGDTGFAIAVDTSLDAYFAGVTNSTNFPTAGSPYQSSYQGTGDAFVTKINSSGTALLYSTYLGGSGGSTTATAIALSTGNNIFITGNTDSAYFPTFAPPSGTTTTYPFQQNYGGDTDAFVTQLNATGSSLVYSSYLGGNGFDQGQGIAVDSSGNAYVTGSTQSTNFPITSNPLQATKNGSQNAFVTKVNFTGEALVYSTYLGGSEADTAQSIHVDSSGNAYIAGYTFSSNFPTVPAGHAIQNTLAGGADAFVAELNAAGTALTFSTFLGGTGNDEAYGLALDGSNNIYITGYTVSSNFPTTTGAFQPSLRGPSNAFVSKLSAGGASLLYSTYLGGSGTDKGTAIAVTSGGVAFVTGSTNSSDFPTANPIQATLGLSSSNYCSGVPCPDAFVTQLNPSATGNPLVYSTYLGGSGYDSGQAIALDSTGDPYITGSTSSTNFPVTSPPNSVSIAPPPYKSSLTGTAGNAFVAKIDSGNNPNISISPASLNFGNETISVTSTLQQITIVNPSTVPLTITDIQVTEVDNSITVFTVTEPTTGGCLGTLAGGGASCNFGVAYTPNHVGSDSTIITLTDNAGGVAGTQQTIALSGAGVTAASQATVEPTSLSFSSTNVGSISPPQSVTITNTGTQTLNITQVSVGTSGDFAETNNCFIAPYYGALGVGQSCTMNVTFTPTASGTRSASLAISDTATGSPQNVALTGIGAAAFTLSTPTANNPVIIGSTQTTFTLVANGPTSFTGAISLACSAGSTCAFSTNPVFVGGSTILTISALSPNPPSNPYLFTVTGTSGSQTTSLQLSLGFMDYTLTITPSSYLDQAGAPATYTVYVNPLFTFSQQVNLSIYTTSPALPDYTYSFSPTATPTPPTNGTGPVSVTLTINTAKYVAPTHAPPRFPSGKLPPLIFGLLSLAGLASLALGNRRRARHGWLGSAWLGVRLATLSLILAFNLALAACRPSTLTTSGTTTGNYVITLSGTLNSNTSVVRFASTNLSVTSAVP